MKIITISDIGYNHPSQANWNYNIWKVDLIDTKNSYNMSYTTKENFGGDSRFIRSLEALNIPVIKTKEAYTGTGSPKITEIAKLPILDSEKFIAEVVEWYKKPESR